MRLLQAVGGVLALVTSVLVLRIVLHLYHDHGHLDVFHLVVGIAAALAGLALAWRARPVRGA